MNIVKKQIKEELKQLAKDIRLKKKLLKSKQRDLSATYKDHSDVEYAQYDFRIKHVARCMLRGTPYEKIESKVRPGNEIDMDSVKFEMDQYKARIEEGSNE